MADRSIFKQRHYQCAQCGARRSDWAWDYDTFVCLTVGCENYLMTMYETYSATGESAAVHGDEIDEVVKHGICNPDGSPRRFRSKTEKYRALADNNLVIVGDTPKTKGVRWV